MRFDRLDEDDAPVFEADSPALEAEARTVEHDPLIEVDADNHADLKAIQTAYSVEYRAIVEAEYRTAWDKALPAFQRGWEQHKERYPHPERSQPTVQNDGSWSGDGPLNLEANQNATVDRYHHRISEIGKEVILPDMRLLEAEDSARYLAGVNNCLKKPERLKEKVANDVVFKGYTAEKSLDNVKDAIRFTLVYDDKGYTEGVYADCARLETRGFERFDRQNFWQDDQYKGINSRWREPESGLLFEVQFHTQASFDAKQLTHQAYERLRGSLAGDAEREELEVFQSAVSAMIPIPPGATEIENYSPEKRDG